MDTKKLIDELRYIRAIKEPESIIDELISTLSKYSLIETKDLESLIEDEKFLIALRGCGVDNWEGYEDAKEIYSEMD